MSRATLLERPLVLPVPETVVETDLEPQNIPVRVRTCSGCYLTETELCRTGLLGCPRCYETFLDVIAGAVATLHGVCVPESWYRPAPRARPLSHPWPTRRGVPRFLSVAPAEQETSDPTPK